MADSRTIRIKRIKTYQRFTGCDKLEIHFTKMHGLGNDFIMIDHREEMLQAEDLAAFVRQICRPHFHVGANGVILLETSESADFRMRYFNADGSEGEMCGNGARCVAKFAYRIGVAASDMVFETKDGLYEAKILEKDKVQIKFPDVSANTLSAYTSDVGTLYFLHVGVPHVVFYSTENMKLDDSDFVQTARKIRNNDVHFPNGTNVNIVEVLDDHLAIRTYERGVEEETFACGSGATAAAIVSTILHQASSPIDVETKGGKLIIEFVQQGEKFHNITLTGNAQTVFHGKYMYNI